MLGFIDTFSLYMVELGGAIPIWLWVWPVG
jgi:hypothetical protein